MKRKTSLGALAAIAALVAAPGFDLKPVEPRAGFAQPARRDRSPGPAGWRVKSDLIRAAEILDEEAVTIRECETVNGHWPDCDEWSLAAHARHDEYVALANRLRKALA